MTLFSSTTLRASCAAAIVIATILLVATLASAHERFRPVAERSSQWGANHPRFRNLGSRHRPTAGAADDPQHYPTPPPSAPGSVSLVYRTTWHETYWHYAVNGGAWNSIPGLEMQCPDASLSSRYPCSKYRQATIWADTVIFVTTNGKGAWDNNGGRNYDLDHSGLWLLDHGKVTLLDKYAGGCPMACSHHGTCDAKFNCQCDSGWFGPTCASNCTCTGPHEACNPVTGVCECAKGWHRCGGKQCTVDTATSNADCGKCGRVCKAGPHAISATCVAGQCVAKCEPGYKACSDGTCGHVCPLPGCETYHLNGCPGNGDHNTSRALWNNTWQSPTRGSPTWIPSYQDMDKLVGFVDYRYKYDASSKQHTAVTLIVKTKTRDPTATVRCSFSGGSYGACSKTIAAPTKGPVLIRAKASDGALLQLDPVDLIWDIEPLAPRDGDFRDGQKGSVVELFGWRHEDIGDECAFLAKAGYLGAKFFPMTEQVMSAEPMNNVPNPWYFFYQSVSWSSFAGRMGTAAELRDAIKRCRRHGVRLYADAVYNDLVGEGNDRQAHRNDANSYCTTWPMKTSSADFPPRRDKLANGTKPWFTSSFAFEPAPDGSGKPPMQEFPALALSPEDFHCDCPISSWTSATELNYCYLVGLVDLNTERDFVRERIAAYLTSLLSMGFSGFRVDAAKHVSPNDQADIYRRLKRNLGGMLPPDFFTYMEVLTGGECEMLVGSASSNYSYSVGLENLLKDQGFTPPEVQKIKIWGCFFPVQTHTCDNNLIDPLRLAIQNDDADEQSTGSTSRDLENYGSVLVIEKNVESHRHFEKKLFLDPRHVQNNNDHYPIRLLLSSFWLPPGCENNYPVPDGLSRCELMTINAHTCNKACSLPRIKGHLPGAPGYTNISGTTVVGGEYTRVHRDGQIINAMRQWVKLPPLPLNEDDGGLQIARELKI